MENLTKKEIELAGLQAGVNLIESGEDCLPRYIEITRQIALLEAEKKTIKEAAFDERALYGSDVLEMQGAKISISNTGDIIQYDKDPIISELKQAIKAREKDVKTAVKSSGIYFDADGIQVDKVPVKYGSDVIKIQL